MSLLADALQPFLLREFVAIHGRVGHGALPDILVTPSAAFDLAFDNPTQVISIDFRTPDIITPALAADCCRLSTASFQSIASISHEMLERDNVAWSLIKLYYSAFYAGHTIIRLFGETCSYFDQQHAKRLRVLAAALGRPPSFAVESGMYHCVLGANHTALDCKKRAEVPEGHTKRFGTSLAIVCGVWLTEFCKALWFALMPKQHSRR